MYTYLRVVIQFYSYPLIYKGRVYEKFLANLTGLTSDTIIKCIWKMKEYEIKQLIAAKHSTYYQNALNHIIPWFLNLPRNLIVLPRNLMVWAWNSAQLGIFLPRILVIMLVAVPQNFVELKSIVMNVCLWWSGWKSSLAVVIFPKRKIYYFV